MPVLKFAHDGNTTGVVRVAKSTCAEPLVRRVCCGCYRDSFDSLSTSSNGKPLDFPEDEALGESSELLLVICFYLNIININLKVMLF